MNFAETSPWMVALVSSLVLVFYVYLGYPLFLGLVALVRSRPVAPARTHFPSVSIVISAYNEARAIQSKILNTVGLHYPKDKLEVVVVSDCSSDRTAEIVRAFPDERVRLLDLSSRHGKTGAQNEAVAMCRGEIIVFSDATTFYTPYAIEFIASNYADPRVGAVSGRYDYRDTGEDSPTIAGAATFWSYENIIKALQSRIHTLTGCSGCIYSVRRDLYTPLSPESCSDIVEPLHVVRKGYRVVYDSRARAVEGPTSTIHDEFRMRVRVAKHGIHAVYEMRELLNVMRYGWISFQLLSHKVLRWTVPFLLVVIYVSSGMLAWDSTAAAVAFWLQTAFYVAALITLWLRPRMPAAGMPLYFCTINVAVFVSIWQLLRGSSRHQTWETIRS